MATQEVLNRIEKLEDEWAGRVKDMAEATAEMKQVNKERREFDAELKKAKDDEKVSFEEWKADVLKQFSDRLEATEKSIAQRRLDFGLDEKPKRKKAAVLHDVARYSLGLIKASRWGGGDDSFLREFEKSYQALSKAGPLVTDTGTAGQEFVPRELASEIFQLLEDEGMAMSMCTRVPMDTMNVDVADPGAVQLNWQSVLGGEGTAATDQQPTTAKSTLAADTLIATMGLTNQLLKTSSPNLVAIYTTRFVRRMTREFEKQILMGSGTPFTGISNKAGVNEVVLADTKTKPEDVTFSNITALIAKLSKEALRGAKWWLSPSLVAVLRNITGGATGNDHPIWAPPGGNQPATIYGIPYETSFEMLATTGAAQASKIFMELGNLEHCLLGIVEDIRFDVSQDVAFRAYMAVLRSVIVGAVLIPDGTAFGRLKTAAS